MADTTESFDVDTFSAFESIVGNHGLDILMQSITETGDVFYMFVFGVALLIIKRTRRVGITLMILLVIATLLTGYIKCAVDRDRPMGTFPDTGFPVEVSQDTFALFCEGGFTASYPSGHASRAAIFGIILGYALSDRFPRGSYLLLLYPFLISISRLYVLEHYPMDIIGGAILGILLAGILAKKTKLHRIFDKSMI